MKKRIISILLVICIAATLLPTQAIAAQTNGTIQNTSVKNPFSDVHTTDWFYDNVMYALQYALFAGVSDTQFDPMGTMTRAMYVVVMGRIAGINPEDYKGETGFSDVPADSWCAPYVNWAKEKGIADGVGEGKFDPNGLITREQIAVLTVRFFESYGIAFPEKTTNTQPKDLELVASYARDAVLKLWSCGLFQGDANGNFNPKNKTTRAEAAALCGRTHKTVTGVTDEEENKEQGGSSSTQRPNNPSGGGTQTTYYKVTYAMGTGEDGTDVQLPTENVYEKGTKLFSLPTPFQQNTIFLGWYYDAAMTQGVESDDTLTRDITLYADMANGVTSLSEMDTPTYFTERDVGTDYTIYVRGSSEGSVKAELEIINITGGNEAVAYQITNSGSGIFKVTSTTYIGGQTYTATLPNDSACKFTTAGGADMLGVYTLNFTTAKAEVLNLGLNDEIIYIEVTDVSNETGTALDEIRGLAQVSLMGEGESEITQDKASGSFDYEGTLAEGDLVCIYTGTRPDKRTLDSGDEAAAYLTITQVQGNTYSYTTADAQEVLFTPDVLPIESSDSTDGAVEVLASALDFSDPKYADMNLNAETTADVGDYIAFYSGNLTSSNYRSQGYGKIIEVSHEGDAYTLTYEVAEQTDVLAAMDIYNEEKQEIVVTDDQKQKIEQEIKDQTISSGFIDEAAEYLTALALETDGFQALSGDMDLESYNIEFVDGSAQDLDEVDLMAVTAKITDRTINVSVNNKLEYFDDSRGIRVALALAFRVELSGESGNAIVIELSAVFAQEVLLDINVSGGAVWKWYVIPVIVDYRMNANIDVGTYTGIAITATAYTQGAEEEDEFEWKKPSTGHDLEKTMIDIGDQITKLMEASEDPDEEGDFAGIPPAGLAEKYAEMIEASSDTWIELFRVSIFSVQGFIDPFSILAFGVGADFVVQANMYVTLGMTFEYANAKRYNFSLTLWGKGVTNETIDLEPAHYTFEFYVMGTVGIKAGIEFEAAIGLFSLALDKIGITAQAGAYAQLWGYFHYLLEWQAQTNQKTSQFSGALYIEIGIYLEIGLIAQLLSSDKLAFAPTLYEHEWPVWSAGEQDNVYDFGYAPEDAIQIMLFNLKTQSLPDDVFLMEYMDMVTGESEQQKAYPANRFYISFTNNAFSFENGKVVVDTDAFSESGEIRISWAGAPLAFTSDAITRIVPITWAKNENGRYIAFENNGGSLTPMLFDEPGAAIARPTETPKKQGYVFDNWYADAALTTPFVFPASMPDYPASPGDADYMKGITVYAKWTPATNTAYTVRHFTENLSGNGYTLVKDDTKVYHNGVTDSKTNVHGEQINSYVGFTPKAVEQQTVLPDGSTVVDVYYSRNSYHLNFVHGKDTTKDLHYSMKYEAKIYTPLFIADGFAFQGWTASISDFVSGKTIMPAGPVTLTANWKGYDYTVTLVTGGGTLEDPAFPQSGDYYVGTYEAGVGLAALPATVTKTGNVFTGWYTKAEGGEKVTGISATQTGHKTYYAQYQPATIAVTFDANGGSGTMAPLSFQYGVAKTLPTNTFTRTGFVFIGWSTSATATEATYTDGASVTLTSATPVTLYAVWQAGTGTQYTVKHLQEDLDGRYTEVADSQQTLTGITGANTAAAANTYTGFAAQPITQATINGDGSTVVEVKYTRNSYTLTWNPGEGALGDTDYTGKDNNQVKFGTPIVAPALVLAGRKGSWTPDVATTMPAANTTYTAQWAAAVYTITLDLGTTHGNTAYKNGYTVPTEYAPTSGTITLPIVDNFALNGDEGYTFWGWYDNANFTGTPITSFKATDAKDKTFYAKWFEGTAITTQKQLEDVTYTNLGNTYPHVMGGNYYLANDITLDNWTRDKAIGLVDGGYFYGNGKTITYGDNVSYSLFGQLSYGSTVDGLTITGTLNVPEVNGQGCFGGLASTLGDILKTRSGSVLDCKVVNLTFTAHATGEAYIGAMIGRAYGESLIRGCSVTDTTLTLTMSDSSLNVRINPVFGAFASAGTRTGTVYTNVSITQPNVFGNPATEIKNGTYK